MKALDLINYLSSKGYKIADSDTNNPFIIVNGNKIIFDIQKSTYSVDGITPHHKRILDLSKPENHSVVMFLIKLFEKGYSKSSIVMEKDWPLGHNEKGSLDIMLQNPKNNDIYMIEVKSSKEIESYINLNNEDKTKQLFSYAMQEPKKTKLFSYYAYDFNAVRDVFYNVYADEIIKEAQNTDDLFDRWNKIWDENDFIICNDIFNLKKSVKKYADLKCISDTDTKKLFKQFATILRLFSISDKPNAFIKMINLFLAKIADEITVDKEYKIKDKYGNVHNVKGMMFQYVSDIDTPESFMKRLNELYKTGMHEYLKKDVIDYNDEEIEKFVKNDNKKELFEIFDNLRLKKNNNFAFIDVYDDETFYENCDVVKNIVELLQNFKFKYDTKHQFLGDFFEELLNTSLKQEAGQFFTPYPLVDFMIEALPYEKTVINNLQNRKNNFIPSVIDYACGAGHFLVSSMAKVQNILSNITLSNLTPTQKAKIKSYIDNPYSWVSRENVIGIEKDYRLAKTTKIATFLNGDGDAEIISGDGINAFRSHDYENTILHKSSNKNEIFDFLISNPPYSVDGFMRNFTKNGITPTTNDFKLFKKVNYNDSNIETYFVERGEQLLKKDGYAAIVLPQSILSSKKYSDMREFIFNNFIIKGMLLTSDITFSGTTTSPVILFLKKQKPLTLHYNVMIMCSPKYLSPASGMKDKEVDFLGYEFSSNREKSGLEIKQKSAIKQISPIIKQFISNDLVSIPDSLKENVFMKYLDEIVLNKQDGYVGEIYPKFIGLNNGVNLSKYCVINARKKAEFTNLPNKYIEINGLDKLTTSNKNKKTSRLCKKGDILISSLCPIKKEKIVISDGEYMLTSAIYVLSGFENDKIRDHVFKQLKTDNVIKQISTMSKGFKVTYSKIKHTDLINQIYIEEYKEK